MTTRGKYALVLAAHFTVMLYETWEHYQVGCVLETSDDRKYLERQAEERNDEKEREEQEEWERMGAEDECARSIFSGTPDWLRMEE